MSSKSRWQMTYQQRRHQNKRKCWFLREPFDVVKVLTLLRHILSIGSWSYVHLCLWYLLCYYIITSGFCHCITLPADRSLLAPCQLWLCRTANMSFIWNLSRLSVFFIFVTTSGSFCPSVNLSLQTLPVSSSLFCLFLFDLQVFQHPPRSVWVRQSPVLSASASSQPAGSPHC